MINVRIDSNQCHLFVEGHAEYAPKGQDIVCAAVSALAQTLAAHPCCGSRVDNGRIHVWANRPMQEIFKAFEIGFCAMAHQYPEHVQIGGLQS